MALDPMFHQTRHPAELNRDLGENHPDSGALRPSTDPATNLRSINDCLASGDHRAALTPGTYPVNGGIVVPNGAQLTGDTTYPIIRLVANPQQATRLVRFTGSNASVTKIRLDASNLLALGCSDRSTISPTSIASCLPKCTTTGATA